MYLSYTFNLPACIANGEYLLRIQSMGIHNPYPAGDPQVSDGTRVLFMTVANCDLVLHQLCPDQRFWWRQRYSWKPG